MTTLIHNQDKSLSIQCGKHFYPAELIGTYETSKGFLKRFYKNNRITETLHLSIEKDLEKGGNELISAISGHDSNSGKHIFLKKEFGFINIYELTR